MTRAKGRLVDGGRVVVPAAMRKAMGLEIGSTVLLELHGDELRIRPARAGLSAFQDYLSAYAPTEGSIVDDLIAQRRAEAGRE